MATKAIYYQQVHFVINKKNSFRVNNISYLNKKEKADAVNLIQYIKRFFYQNDSFLQIKWKKLYLNE